MEPANNTILEIAAANKLPTARDGTLKWVANGHITEPRKNTINVETSAHGLLMTPSLGGSRIQETTAIKNPMAASTYNTQSARTVAGGIPNQNGWVM